MELICSRCRQLGYLTAISTGVCGYCGRDVFTPHLPPYKACEQCAMKNQVCQKCGEKVMPKLDVSDKGMSIGRLHVFGHDGDFD